MSPAAPTYSVPLNYSEHAYAAFDGFMGSMPQVYLLRFDQPVAAGALRSIARELLATQDRLRGVIEPGWIRCRLRILADDHVVDQLFDHAWQESPHLDAGSLDGLEAVHNRLLNEVLPIERGLGCRFLFIDHPRTPVLFFTVHHLLGDGRSMVHWVQEMLRRLNGGPPMVRQPAEGPSLMPALWPRRWRDRPAALRRSLGHERRQAALHRRLHVQQVQTADQPVLSTHALRYFTSSVPASALRATARRLGLSVNSLITLVLTETFLAQAAHDPLAAALVRLSVDMRRHHPEATQHQRPLWGNHVCAFLVTETGRRTLQERADSIRVQVDEGLARFERREMGGPYLVYEILPWLGRTAVGRLAMQMQRKLKMRPISAHATSLGNVSHLNPPGGQTRLDLLVAAVPSLAALHVLVEIDDRLMMPLVWQRAEADVARIDAYLQRLDLALRCVVRAEPSEVLRDVLTARAVSGRSAVREVA